MSAISRIIVEGSFNFSIIIDEGSFNFIRIAVEGDFKFYFSLDFRYVHKI